MNPPRLTIAIPTKDRPDWCLRALSSAFDQLDGRTDVEILVSDNSADDETQRMVSRIPQQAIRYWRNSPPTEMVENWNHLLSKATGQYILWLHDDDYMLPGSVRGILETLSKYPERGFHVFSARIIDDRERPMRRGGQHKDEPLCPRAAILALFTHSSFIRFPSAVVQAELVRSSGGFFEDRRDLADLCLWSRLAASTGISCHSLATIAYTIHPAQTTSRMFTESTLAGISKMAGRFEYLLGTTDLNNALGRFFWRFVIGGATRALKNGDLKEVKRILQISKSELFQSKPCPGQWLPLRSLLARAGSFG